MSATGNINLKYPPTPPTSSKLENDDDELFASMVGNPTQNTLYVPDGSPHPIQKCQQLTPIPATPESPTPKNCRQRDISSPFDLPDTPAASHYTLPSFSTVN